MKFNLFTVPKRHLCHKYEVVSAEAFLFAFFSGVDIRYGTVSGIIL
jgi:hypothetical protein